MPWRRKRALQKFVSVQGHYNLIFREEEREMIPYCREEGIAVTPYSALAGGRLSKLPGETSKSVWKRIPMPRASTTPPRRRMPVSSSAWRNSSRRHGVSHDGDRAGLADPQGGHSRGRSHQAQPRGRRRPAPRHWALTEEEVAYLEACYTPHALVGVMAQNTREAADRPGVWSQSTPKV